MNEQKSSRVYPRLQFLGIVLGFTLVFSVVMAFVVTYVMRIGFFSYNLVFSVCHGMVMALVAASGKLLIWDLGRPPKIPFFILIVVAFSVAKFFGNRLAIAALGLPPELIYSIQEQNATGFLILTVLASSFVTWFFWTRGRLQWLRAQAETEKARASDIEKRALQAQLQLLQAQIEPHMLFNTLANLQGLIAVDPPRAQHMLDQLILYLRATLSSSRSNETALRQEFSLMEAYLELMSIRMGSRLTYTLQLPEELANTPVPPMLLQPLVENAIKHGIEPKVEGGNIVVSAKQEGNALRLSVADTGLGLHASGNAPTNGTNLGLANIRERLHALYCDRASFSLTANTPTGVLAQLDIPL
jgi:signal transduction histidine kinase